MKQISMKEKRLSFIQEVGRLGSGCIGTPLSPVWLMDGTRTKGRDSHKQSQTDRKTWYTIYRTTTSPSWLVPIDQVLSPYAIPLQVLMAITQLAGGRTQRSCCEWKQRQDISTYSLTLIYGQLLEFENLLLVRLHSMLSRARDTVICTVHQVIRRKPMQSSRHIRRSRCHPI